MNVKVCVRRRDGSTTEIDARIGKTLMLALASNRVPGIEAACGGSHVCGTCHAYVEEPLASKLPPRDRNEESILNEALNVQPNSRVTCMLTVTEDFDGGVVTVPPAS